MTLPDARLFRCIGRALTLLRRLEMESDFPCGAGGGEGLSAPNTFADVPRNSRASASEQRSQVSQSWWRLRWTTGRRAWTEVKPSRPAAVSFDVERRHLEQTPSDVILLWKDVNYADTHNRQVAQAEERRRV